MVVKRNIILKEGLLVLAFFAITNFSFSQTTLDATSPGRSYEEIDSVLGLNNGAMEETPDQCTSHPQFGRHILEVWDTTFNKNVFEFYIHVHPDNDRCINFDRQRSEIKTDASSPTYLKGYTGNHLTYTWMFKLPKKFQAGPLFTHIHQIKAVNGDYSSPLFTLSPYASGTKRQMQIVYVQDSTTNQVVVKYCSLDSCLGIWVKATENLTVGVNGTYSIVLNRVSDGKVLLTYSNNNIETIRPSNDFIRPKWGLYRSLVDSINLRDDTMRLSDVYLFNNALPTAPTSLSINSITSSSMNLKWVETENNLSIFSVERSLDGITWDSVASVRVGTSSFMDTGLLSSTRYYYRVKAENPAGSSSYTNITNAITLKALPIMMVSLNCASTETGISINWVVNNEVGLSKCEIETSSNGTDFNCVGTVLATGKDSYTYIYNATALSKNYFRIKLINKDGTITYSSISEVESKTQSLVSIYPNPVKDNLNIHISNNSPTLNLVIFDAVGNIVWSRNNFNLGDLSIGTSHLANGSYYLQIKEKNKSIKCYPFIIKK